METQMRGHRMYIIQSPAGLEKEKPAKDWNVAIAMKKEIEKTTRQDIRRSCISQLVWLKSAIRATNP
jgi:hypothetical protein